MIRARSVGREAALQALYQIDLRADLEDEAAEELIDECKLKLADSRAFALELVRGTLAHAESIDEELKAVAINWRVERMAVIDRNILRLGIYELLHQPKIPPAVTINEAVLLAKKFSTKDSGGFVNGILDKVHQRHADVATGETE